MPRALLLVILTVVLLVSSGARAAGGFPASTAVLFDANDAKTVYVPTNFGLLVSGDSGGSWRWICERAVGASGMDETRYAVTPKGTLVGMTSSGLALSRDRGCTFSMSTGNHVLADLAMRADGEIVGVSSVASTADERFDNHLLSSKDDGQSFTAVGGPIDPTLHLRSVEISPSDPTRLYLSAVRGDGERRRAVLLVSYDGGTTWGERKLDLVKGETDAVVETVDPKVADRVYARTSSTGDAHARLLVTDDAGKTWKKIYEATSPALGFALEGDGSKVYAGSRDGVSWSPTNAFAFTRGSSVEAHCLGVSGGTLWACSTELNGFLAGSSKGGAQSFEAKLHFDNVKGPLECPQETSVAKYCTTEWPKLQRQLGLPEAGEKPRNVNSGGPALRGSSTRTGGSRGGRGAIAGIALLGIVGYFVLQRLRRR